MNKNISLLQKFIVFNAKHRLAGPRKKILLAVSGGIDSSIMCHLFAEAGYAFGIAHCNFQLRGEEANADEAFVTQLGANYGVPVFVNRFNTKDYAAQKGISIQLAARELRYNWFEELRLEKGFNYVATAHNLNDNIETILFNLTRGTGVKGLRGIPLLQGKIIRPILFAPRADIESYCKEQALQYREDSSNAEDKYTRNKIRHNVIPLLKEINPNLEETFGEKVELFNFLEELYEKETSKLAKQLFINRKNDIYIPIRKLQKTQHAPHVLFEFLKDYGFNAEQVEDMLAVITESPGKQFISNTARIIKDRHFFILTRLPEKDFTVKLIHEGETEVVLEKQKLKLTGLPISDTKITPDRHTAFIDYSKLQFPLTIRRWKDGDYFYPFGMKMKKKKLKKFFIDEKVPLNEKENIWVIESDSKIIWVVGYRIDERFKLKATTERVLKIQVKQT